MDKGYVRARSTYAAGITPTWQQACLPFPLSPHIKATRQSEQVLGRQSAWLYTFCHPEYAPIQVAT